MTEYKELIKVGADHMGFDPENIDEDKISSFLAHIKIEILAVMLIIFVYFIPVEYIANFFLKTNFSLLYKLLIFTILFFILRRVTYFRAI